MTLLYPINWIAGRNAQNQSNELTLNAYNDAVNCFIDITILSAVSLADAAKQYQATRKGQLQNLNRNIDFTDPQSAMVGGQPGVVMSFTSRNTSNPSDFNTAWCGLSIMAASAICFTVRT